jgi:hypothetical protein
MSANVMFLIFLPGVIIHELAHALLAVLLFVRAAHMEFAPKQTSDGLRLGSVGIERVDPIRRSIIGFAPVLIGFLSILGIVYFSISNFSFFQKQNIFLMSGFVLIILYFIFAISNTMFSSKKDMEGTIEVVLVALVLVIVGFIAGIRIDEEILKSIFENQTVIDVAQNSALFLAVPIIIDIVLLGILSKINKKLEARS